MKLFDITFPSPSRSNIETLYYRGNENIVLSEDGISLSAGNQVFFDTYFNAFSHIKYHHYTRAEKVILELSLEGKGRIDLWHYITDENRIKISSCPYNGNVEVCFNVCDFQNKGFIYFSLFAESDTKVLGGQFVSDILPSAVKIGVCICTYKREKYVEKNIQTLLKYFSNTSNIDNFEVFVIDNGKTLNADYGDRITVIPNENTGGSGGFTRGIQEVCKRDFTHFLLMDDDIVFDSAVLERTLNLLRCLKTEYSTSSIGGAMLYLDQPTIQQELGADWMGCALQGRQHKKDAIMAQTVAANEEDEEPEYNAWWFMCMPVSAARKYGLPLPMFIRCDDVEYGLRACEHLIVTSGIAVWHESFENKYSPEMDYYIKRNELITNARFPKGKGLFANYIKLIKSVGKQLAFQRYFAINLVFRAYDDYLKGANFFLKIKSASLHAELRSNVPKMLSKQQIFDNYGLQVDEDAIQQLKWVKGKYVIQLLTLNGYLLPKFLHKKTVGICDSAKCKPKHFFMYRKMVQYNPYTGVGFVTELQKKELFKTIGKLLMMFFKLVFKYRKAKKSFQKIEISIT